MEEYVVSPNESFPWRTPSPTMEEYVLSPNESFPWRTLSPTMGNMFYRQTNRFHGGRRPLRSRNMFYRQTNRFHGGRRPDVPSRGTRCQHPEPIRLSFSVGDGVLYHTMHTVGDGVPTSRTKLAYPGSAKWSE